MAHTESYVLYMCKANKCHQIPSPQKKNKHERPIETGESLFYDIHIKYMLYYTLPGTNMEVENNLFVVENDLARGHVPLPC